VRWAGWGWWPAAPEDFLAGGIAVGGGGVM
jgi:hypothetical protein